MDRGRGTVDETVGRGGVPRRRSPRGGGGRLRAEIVAAAERVLTRIGDAEPFSLRAVAKEAGIAAPSVYLQFDDRTQLVVAVMEALFARLAAARDAAEAAAGGDPLARLRARSRAYLRFALDHPGHYRVLYEGAALFRLEDPRLAACGEPMTRRTAALIREIRGPAVDAGEAHARALRLWSDLHGAASLRIHRPWLAWPEVDAAADAAVAAVLAGPP